MKSSTKPKTTIDTKSYHQKAIKAQKARERKEKREKKIQSNKKNEELEALKLKCRTKADKIMKHLKSNFENAAKNGEMEFCFYSYQAKTGLYWDELENRFLNNGECPDYIISDMENRLIMGFLIDDLEIKKIKFDTEAKNHHTPSDSDGFYASYDETYEYLMVKF